MAQSQTVHVQIADRVATLTVDHPPVNAVSWQMLQELEQAFAEVLTNRQVKTIIITGAGERAFIAGADIKELAQQAEDDEANRVRAQQRTARGQALLRRVETGGKPVIAAINGVALGGGLELALACHLRVCSESARLGLPEIKLGIIPGWGGTQRLPRLLGFGKATELILSGEIVDAGEALRLGLVNRVMPAGSLLQETQELAATLAEKSAIALGAALDAMYTGITLPLDEALAYEQKCFGSLHGTHDMQEGLRAFVEKRQPQFKDR